MHLDSEGLEKGHTRIVLGVFSEESNEGYPGEIAMRKAVPAISMERKIYACSAVCTAKRVNVECSERARQS